MVSPARKHFLKSRAKREAEQASEYGGMQDATQYELQLAQLNSDRSRLKQVQSSEHKEALKKTLLPNYLPYVDGVIESNAGVQDDIVTTMMVWLIDVGDYAKALQVAEYVIKHDLKMADQFERKPVALVTENIANAALSAIKAGKDFDIDVLTSLSELVNGLDMHNQVLAKLYLAIGKLRLASVPGDFSTGDPSFYTLLLHAELNLSRAIDLNEHCGGKNDLAKAKKMLAKVVEEQPEMVKKFEAAHTPEQEQQPSGNNLQPQGE